MKWKDARIHKPNFNHCDRYAVLFKYCDDVFQGFATWMPTFDYKGGFWASTEATNGNKLEGEVLYWHPFLAKPEDIEL